MLITATASVLESNANGAKDGSSTPGNTTSVVYLTGSLLRRTNCEDGTPVLEEGKKPTKDRNSFEGPTGAGVSVPGHVLVYFYIAKFCKEDHHCTTKQDKYPK